MDLVYSETAYSIQKGGKQLSIQYEDTSEK